MAAVQNAPKTTAAAKLITTTTITLTRTGDSFLDAIRPQGGALVGVAIDGLKTSNDIHVKHGHIYTV